MSLNSSYVPPLSRFHSIVQLYDDLEKISYTENSSQILDRYAFILQSAYINQFTGLKTTISNTSGDSSLDVFVSANDIGSSLGDPTLSASSISEILSSCQSPLSNLNQHPAFKAVYDDLLKRRDHLQSLGSASSIGGLSLHAGHFSTTGGLPLQVGSLGSLQQGGRLGLSQYGVPTANEQYPLVSSLQHSEIVLPAIPILSLNNHTLNPVGSSSKSPDLVSDSNDSSEFDENDIKIKVFPRGKNYTRICKSKPKPIKLSCRTLESLFEMPMKEAATELGMGLTAFKNACRKLGIKKWPYRQTYTTPTSRSQRRGSASSVSSRQAASSSSRTSFSTQEVAAVASLSASREAGDAFQAASSSSGASLPVTIALSSSIEEASGALSSSIEEAALSSSGASSPGNYNLLEVGSDVDFSDVDLMDPLFEQDSGDELPPNQSFTKKIEEYIFFPPVGL